MENTERKPTLDEIADGDFKIIFDGIEYDNINLEIKNGKRILTLEKIVTEEEFNSNRYKYIFRKKINEY